MKKLKLLMLNLQDSEVLSREQLKHILGGDGGSGSGSGNCMVVCVQCTEDSDCSYKPNLYCASSTQCPAYPKVCRRAILC